MAITYSDVPETQQQNVGESRTAHFKDGAESSRDHGPPVAGAPGGSLYNARFAKHDTTGHQETLF